MNRKAHCWCKSLFLAETTMTSSGNNTCGLRITTKVEKEKQLSKQAGWSIWFEAFKII